MLTADEGRRVIVKHLSPARNVGLKSLLEHKPGSFGKYDGWINRHLVLKANYLI